MTNHRSAANIEVPSARPEPPAEDDVAAFFRSLRELEAACSKANSHDRIAVLISAVIEHGWNSKGQITGTLVRLGYGGPHAAKLLEEHSGVRWRLDRAGRYVSLGDV